MKVYTEYTNKISQQSDDLSMKNLTKVIHDFFEVDVADSFSTYYTQVSPTLTMANNVLNFLHCICQIGIHKTPEERKELTAAITKAMKNEYHQVAKADLKKYDADRLKKLTNVSNYASLAGEGEARARAEETAEARARAEETAEARARAGEGEARARARAAEVISETSTQINFIERAIDGAGRHSNFEQKKIYFWSEIQKNNYYTTPWMIGALIISATTEDELKRAMQGFIAPLHLQSSQCYIPLLYSGNCKNTNQPEVSEKKSEKRKREEGLSSGFSYPKISKNNIDNNTQPRASSIGVFTKQTRQTEGNTSAAVASYQCKVK